MTAWLLEYNNKYNRLCGYIKPHSSHNINYAPLLYTVNISVPPLPKRKTVVCINHLRRKFVDIFFYL
jgi:hypothetical protein